jgi:hypothetical protein
LMPASGARVWCWKGSHHVEVGTLTLREAVLAVELELGRDARVLTPAVHVKRRLGKHERAGVGEAGARRDVLGSIEESGVRAPADAQAGLP